MNWNNLKESKIVWFGIAFLMMVALVFFADIGQFLTSLGKTDPSMFIVALVFGMSSLFIWSWVWHRFFDKMDIRSSPVQTIRMFMAGHFLNSITPLGQFGGEPILAYIISHNTDTSYENAFSCVISSDLLNATPFFTFTLGGLVYLAFFGGLEGFLIEIALLTIILLVLGAVMAYLLWFDNTLIRNAIFGILDKLESVIGRGEKYFEAARASIDEIKESLSEVSDDPKFLLEQAVISHMAIIGQIISLYFVMLSLGIEPDFVSIYLIVNLSALATISPTPGGSGTYEAAFSGIMMLFYPVKLATALTASILFRLTTYWPGIVVGYVALLTLNRKPDI